ncbi:uncharacterized protein [Musca autumnalis]|uniref:uncharacterized protein n=1 Tax=Musca autumnalis TaxID=221902 RepID=UPI003CF15D2A
MQSATDDLALIAENIAKAIDEPTEDHLKQIVKRFIDLPRLLEQRTSGIYSLVVKWFRLYLRMQISVNPKNEKLCRKFEHTIPIAISYIIGCLQYKGNTKVSLNYHRDLLDIMDTILSNCQPNVMKEFQKFERGIISHLWKTVSFAGDFSTQQLALTIFAKLLNSLGRKERDEELKTIQFINLKAFKESINKVIEESQRMYAFDNACRDLLNNFNMNLSKRCLVFSFYCSNAVLNDYAFFPPYSNKFWMDLNYYSQTISFKCRVLPDTDSYKLRDLDVIIKWNRIEFEHDYMLVTIEKKGISSLPSSVQLELRNHNILRIHLSATELKRLSQNDGLMEYFQEMNNANSKDVQNEELITHDATTPKSTAQEKISKQIEPVTAEQTSDQNDLKIATPRSPKQETKIRQNALKRKFFSYFESEDEMELSKNKPAKKETTRKKKTTRTKRARILKPRADKKTICAVIPIVDLTKSPKKLEDKRTTQVPSPNMNTRKILKDINVNCDNNGADSIYDYRPCKREVEPCQSYRNFKTRRMASICPNEKDIKQEKIATAQNNVELSDKENIALESPNMSKIFTKNPRKRAIPSQDLFSIIKSDEDLKENKKYTKDNYESRSSLKRRNIFTTPVSSPISFPQTPKSPMNMTVSDFHDTPQRGLDKNIKMNTFLGEINRAVSNKQLGAENAVNSEIYDDNTLKDCVVYAVNSEIYDDNTLKDCVVYQNRLSDDSDSGDSDIENNFLPQHKHEVPLEVFLPPSSHSKQIQNVVEKDVALHPKSVGTSISDVVPVVTNNNETLASHPVLPVQQCIDLDEFQSKHKEITSCYSLNNTENDEVLDLSIKPKRKITINEQNNKVAVAIIQPKEKFIDDKISSQKDLNYNQKDIPKAKPPIENANNSILPSFSNISNQNEICCATTESLINKKLDDVPQKSKLLRNESLDSESLTKAPKKYRQNVDKHEKPTSGCVSVLKYQQNGEGIPESNIDKPLSSNVILPNTKMSNNLNPTKHHTNVNHSKESEPNSDQLLISHASDKCINKKIQMQSHSNLAQENNSNSSVIKFEKREICRQQKIENKQISMTTTIHKTVCENKVNVVVREMHSKNEQVIEILHYQKTSSECFPKINNQTSCEPSSMLMSRNKNGKPTENDIPNYTHIVKPYRPSIELKFEPNHDIQHFREENAIQDVSIRNDNNQLANEGLNELQKDSNNVLKLEEIPNDPSTTDHLDINNNKSIEELYKNCLKNYFHKIHEIITDIGENIIGSAAQRTELDILKANVEKFIQKMEKQCQNYLTKSEEFER